MDAHTSKLLTRLGAVLVAAIGLQWPLGSALAQTPTQGAITWDQSRSVYNRQIHKPEAAENVNWEARVTALLREEPGDVVITAVARDDVADGGADHFARTIEAVRAEQPGITIEILVPPSQRAQNTYLVVNGHAGKMYFNVGVGKGWTEASDRVVFKAILGFSF